MSGLHWGNVGLEEEGTGWSASSLAIETALRYARQNPRGTSWSLELRGEALRPLEGRLTLDDAVVGANPLEDITNVRRLQLVLKEGRVVSDKRHLSGAVP